MDNLLGRLRLAPLPPGNGGSEDILVLEAMALEWEKMPFTMDFLGKLVSTKETLTKELVEGRLDKFGQDHSDSKRAVIAYVDAILTYLPAIKIKADQVRKAQEIVQQRRSRFEGSIHGEVPLVNI